LESKLKFNISIRKQKSRKVGINGSDLILPMEQAEIEQYSDVTICEKGMDYYVVAMFFHYQEDHYSGVYFYTKTESLANDVYCAVKGIDETNASKIELSGVEIIEVENCNATHEVMHLDLANRKLLKQENSFEKESETS
jgi:hypothetical protein